MTKEENRLSAVYGIALILFSVGFLLYLGNRNLTSEIELLVAKNTLIAGILMLCDESHP